MSGWCLGGSEGASGSIFGGSWADLGSMDRFLEALGQIRGAKRRELLYKIDEKINHIDGMTIESAEHMMATKLYQNNAKVHFNHFVEKAGRFGRRIVYGGHVISLARALSFNGLSNAFKIIAINGGTHASPCFADMTVFAWSKILDKICRS